MTREQEACVSGESQCYVCKLRELNTELIDALHKSEAQKQALVFEIRRVLDSGVSPESLRDVLARMESK